MDTWRYYEVTHSTHDVMNPSSLSSLEDLGRALGLRSGLRVLDVGCGHAAMLLLWRECFGVSGLGVDASPYHSERARRRVAAASAHDIEIREGKGEDITADGSFDVASCLGASWIWGGHGGTLAALQRFTKPGGLVVVGEPHWKCEPQAGFLEAEGVSRETFHDLEGCRRVALDMGLELVWMRGSSLTDWDDYEMRQNVAVDEFARAHPDDEDLPAIRSKRRAADESYLRWGRDCLGWALWAFRTPPALA